MDNYNNALKRRSEHHQRTQAADFKLYVQTYVVELLCSHLQLLGEGNACSHSFAAVCEDWGFYYYWRSFFVSF